MFSRSEKQSGKKKTKLETEWGRKTDECEWGGGVGGGSILMLVVTT